MKSIDENLNPRIGGQQDGSKTISVLQQVVLSPSNSQLAIDFWILLLPQPRFSTYFQLWNALFDQPLREKLQQKLPRSSYMSGSPWPSEWNEIFDQSQLQPGNTPMKSVSQRLSQRDLEEAIPKIGGF